MDRVDGNLPEPSTGPQDQTSEARLHDADFAHSSEREFAELLTYYRIRWEYEPSTFVLDTDSEGNPEVGFTPDFYLPDYDLFIELTTRKPNLMQRKRRKLLELRKRFPEVNIKLMDRSDIQLLITKIAARSALNGEDPGVRGPTQESH